MDAKNQLLESPISEIEEKDETSEVVEEVVEEVEEEVEEKEEKWKYLVGVVFKAEKKIELDFFLEVAPEKLDNISKETLLLDIIEDEEKKYENTPTLREMSKDLFMIKIRMKAQEGIIPCLYESPTKLSKEEILNYLNSVDLDTIRKAEIKM